MNAKLIYLLLEIPYVKHTLESKNPKCFIRLKIILTIKITLMQICICFLSDTYMLYANIYIHICLWKLNSCFVN